MVTIWFRCLTRFQVIANQQGASPSQQLSSASQYLAQNSTSGSAQVYSQGLAQAAQQFQGQSTVTPDNAMTLIQSLLGGGQSAPSQGGDLLGSLLGGQQQSQSQRKAAICWGVTGRRCSAGQSGGQQQDGIDLGDILNAGMNFMNANNRDRTTCKGSLLMSAGPMAKPHRQQSGQVVANALLQAVAGMAKQR
jgi:hypothetical protein